MSCLSHDRSLGGSALVHCRASKQENTLAAPLEKAGAFWQTTSQLAARLLHCLLTATTVPVFPWPTDSPIQAEDAISSRSYSAFDTATANIRTKIFFSILKL